VDLEQLKIALQFGRRLGFSHPFPGSRLFSEAEKNRPRSRVQAKVELPIGSSSKCSVFAKTRFTGSKECYRLIATWALANPYMAGWQQSSPQGR
jgi:hypothetical protein